MVEFFYINKCNNNNNNNSASRSRTPSGYGTPKPNSIHRASSIPTLSGSGLRARTPSGSSTPVPSLASGTRLQRKSSGASDTNLVEESNNTPSDTNLVEESQVHVTEVTINHVVSDTGEKVAIERIRAKIRATIEKSANSEKSANNEKSNRIDIEDDGGVNYGSCPMKIQDEDRFDCYPGPSPTKDSCTARGCCWSLSSNSKVPACYYPHGLESYRIVQYQNHSHGLDVYWKNKIASPYGSDVKLLKMSVTFETETRVHVKITDANATRFEPSLPEVPMFNTRVRYEDCQYDVRVGENQTGFAILRRADQSLVFDSRNLGGFIYSDQFIQISSRLTSRFIYGMGEKRSPFLRNVDWDTSVLWSLDGSPTDGSNGYGYHPFYMNLNATSGDAHGVYLRTSNALEIVLQPTPAITYRVLGGILDFYFFLGPAPGQVVSQYLELVGNPTLPPYWSLGFHLCRYGYHNVSHIQAVVDRNVKAGIPLDTVWVDIDYMERHNDFSINEQFEGLKEYVKVLHAEGRHFIPIIDPGIASKEDKTYTPYTEGLERGIFVKNASGLPVEGSVWNDRGGTVFPDFSNPDTVDYWLRQLKLMYSLFEFDGLWIDMNEPSNFVNGSLQGCPSNSKYESPPYTPHVYGGSLNYKTLCMESQHHEGLHYNLHTMYGTMETVATNFALKEILNTRPVIISRSTYAGHGKYGGHWTGDVYSTYADMKQSIGDILSLNMFGVSLVGADICGFNGASNAALCQRWLQLGAFYPFSRNHNEDSAPPQDPAYYGPEVIASTRKAYQTRYQLLPYLYSLFYRASLFGETVARSLLFEFPRDSNTWTVDSQFLWGPALLIAPALEENQTTVNVYLPRGIWYEFYPGKAIHSNGTYYSVPCPTDTIPLYVRGGYIVPMQHADQTTTLSRKNSMFLAVHMNETKQAHGTLYWDDGQSLNTWESKQVTVVEFTAISQSVTSSVALIGYTKEPIILEYISVMGESSNITKVWFNGVEHETFVPDPEGLYVGNLSWDLTKPFNLTWS
uniref:Lysosomal alpha-glucosidase n=1 Tax=Cacopsylla melanoneura TaxID=428564 RepID=A0A8D8XLI2_9HEMI